MPDNTMIADARQHWASIGLDPAQFDQALAGTPAPAVPPSPPGGPSAPPPAPAGINLTKEQATDLANALLAQGMPEARVNAPLDAAGYEFEPALTPEQAAAAAIKAEHDARFGFDTEHEPSDYKINYGDAIRAAPNGIDASELAELNQGATAFLASLQIEPELGAGLVEHLMRTGQELRGMTDAGKELWRREQVAAGVRSAGSDEAYQERVRLAAVTLDAAGKGAFADMIKSGLARHDSWTVATLANFGARLEAWQKSR